MHNGEIPLVAFISKLNVKELVFTDEQIKVFRELVVENDVKNIFNKLNTSEQRYALLNLLELILGGEQNSSSIQTSKLTNLFENSIDYNNTTYLNSNADVLHLTIKLGCVNVVNLLVNQLNFDPQKISLAESKTVEPLKLVEHASEEKREQLCAILKASIAEGYEAAVTAIEEKKEDDFKHIISKKRYLLAEGIRLTVPLLHIAALHKALPILQWILNQAEVNPATLYEAPATKIKQNALNYVIAKAKENGEGLNTSECTQVLLTLIEGRVHHASLSKQAGLHIAAQHGLVELAEQLIAASHSINVQDVNNNTPLHYAARQGDAAMCQLLLENGADPLLINKEGKTPLDIAKQYYAQSAGAEKNERKTPKKEEEKAELLGEESISNQKPEIITILEAAEQKAKEEKEQAEKTEEDVTERAPFVNSPTSPSVSRSCFSLLPAPCSSRQSQPSPQSASETISNSCTIV